MANKKRHKSTLARIHKVRAITMAEYEPGNLRKCYMALWRRLIEPEFGISYRTYLRYLCARPEPERFRHPTLF